MCRKLLPLSVLIFFISFSDSMAQRRSPIDSTLIIRPEMDTSLLKQEIDSVYIEGLEENKPFRATILAAVLPGLGQIYNKRYWKLPVLYGGAAAMGYFIDYNNKKYQQYRSALLEKKSLPQSLWNSVLAQNISEDNLQRGVDYYRRNRDLLMILLAGVYFIQIVDAHVDAHLMEFDISEELVLRIEPGWQPDVSATAGNFGLKFTLNFN